MGIVTADSFLSTRSRKRISAETLSPYTAGADGHTAVALTVQKNSSVQRKKIPMTAVPRITTDADGHTAVALADSKDSSRKFSREISAEAILQRGADVYGRNAVVLPVDKIRLRAAREHLNGSGFTTYW